MQHLAVELSCSLVLLQVELVYFFSVAIVITRKAFKTFTVKQEIYDAIKLLSQSKLDSIANIISQGVQDGDMSSIEFQ